MVVVGGLPMDAALRVRESAGPRGEIGFWRFLRHGAVITAVDLLVGFARLGGERGSVFRAGSGCRSRISRTAGS